MSKKAQREHPVVFISYSQDSREHMDKVLALANKLRQDGIDAVLDQYEISPPEGWPKWMDRQIENADFVLAVCTATYHKRVMATEKPGKGLGVRWESTLMYQHLYDAGAETSKFIPVLFEGGKPGHIPTPLRGATYYCAEQAGGYEGLYRRLTSQPKTKKPKLGKRKSLEAREPKADLLEANWGESAKETGLLRKTKQVTLVIDSLEADLFDSAYRRLLCFGLAGFLEIDPSDVRIVRVEAGSVRVTIEIRKEVVEAMIEAVREGSPDLEDAVKPLRIVQIKVESDVAAEGVERPALPQTKSGANVDVKQLWGIGGFVLVAFVVVIAAITFASRFGGGFWNFMAAVVASFIVLAVLAVIGRFVGVFGEGTVVKFIDAALAALRLGITKGNDAERQVTPESDSPARAAEKPKPHQIETHVSAGDKSPAVGYVEHMEVHYGKEDDDGRGEKVEREQRTGEKTTPPWPKEALPLGGPKISRPFAGRVEELDALRAAMGGEERIVAVVGMAGQGKSCLVGEWYELGARPPEGVGLFWRKVYESGFTFDRFLDELHLYLTGEEIDRQAITTVEARAKVVEDALREKPCWIVLDGAERWLKRWAAEPDAGAEGATADDRAAQDPVLDDFFKAAHFRHNGSRLLLTTRAVPSALDQNPPVTIGQARKKGRRLEDLKPAEAVELLRELGVTGDEAVMQAAAGAYGNHPYAVHVLGLLIGDLYDEDAARWEEVNVLEEKKKDMDVGGLFERIIEHRPEDVGLLSLIACSVGPAPVRMLAERLGQTEPDIRKKLAELRRWQIVEFAGDEADQHTLARKFLTERLGEEATKDLRKAIAAWWAQQKVPARPQKIEDIRPLLKAVEHLLAARDPDAATDIFLTKPSAESYYTLSGWLRAFGYLDENIRMHAEAIRVYSDVIENEGRRDLRNDLASCYNNRGNALGDQGKLGEAIADYGRAIEITEQLVEKEGRRELRNDLAGCCNNRGNAFANQGRLDEAIADYGRAIEIYKELVEKEDRRELRNDLASCYNNRGNAFRNQGRLDEAIADFGRAIEIREQLVEKEGRRELRWDLFSTLFNRAVAYSQRQEWEQARADIDKGGALVRQLIGEGRRHVLGSFLQTAAFRCRSAEKLGDVGKAAQWANDAMRWFVEEAEAGRMNEVLGKAAAGFAGSLGGHMELLVQNGLDGELLEKFQKILKQAG